MNKFQKTRNYKFLPILGLKSREPGGFMVYEKCRRGLGSKIVPSTKNLFGEGYVKSSGELGAATGFDLLIHWDKE